MRLPPEAVTAAANAIHDVSLKSPDGRDMCPEAVWHEDTMREAHLTAEAALEAAAPHLAAAERERCAQLAEQEAAGSDPLSNRPVSPAATLRWFAALLREQP